VDPFQVEGWPAKVDGFSYDVDEFLRCWHARAGWHEPDAVDYARIVDDHRLLAR